jgi:hypothetical protein
MGGYVGTGSAPACYGSSLGSNPDISLKKANGRHKQGSGKHTIARPKNIQKYFIFETLS